MQTGGCQIRLPMAPRDNLSGSVESDHHVRRVTLSPWLHPARDTGAMVAKEHQERRTPEAGQLVEQRGQHRIAVADKAQIVLGQRAVIPRGIWRPWAVGDDGT